MRGEGVKGGVGVERRKREEMEEMEEDDVALGATMKLVSMAVKNTVARRYVRRVSAGSGRPSVSADERSVDVVEQVGPDLTNV